MSSSTLSLEPSPSIQKRKKKELKVVDSDDSDNEASSEVADTPVLSHAERRRQKRKEEKTATEESAPKRRKLQDGTAAPVVSTKRQNSVWVGNMSFKTTQEDLRRFFEGVGEITRINMPTKVSVGQGRKSENRGFAYVDFATTEAKTVAIAKSEMPLIGRKLLIKDGDDYAGRPAAVGADGDIVKNVVVGSKTHSKSAQKILRAQKQPPAPTLFIGNLGFETTEDDIRGLFEAHRERKIKKEELGDDAKTQEKPKDVWIRKIRMGTFEDSGLCKGFAFADFTTVEQASSVLFNPKNHLLNGRKLVVEYAGADAVRRGAPKPKREESTAPAKARESKSYGPRAEGFKRNFERESPSKGKMDSSTAQPACVVEPQTPLSKHHTESESNERKPGFGTERRAKGPRVRPKPGAALALAKRETAAILPSQGKKITF